MMDGVIWKVWKKWYFKSRIKTGNDQTTLIISEIQITIMLALPFLFNSGNKNYTKICEICGPIHNFFH
jgi:hypothetical protein